MLKTNILSLFACLFLTISAKAAPQVLREKRQVENNEIDFEDKEAEIRKYLQYEKIEDLWTLQCKPFIFYTNKAYCMPCMTFKGASFKNEEIGLIGSIMVMAVTMKPSTKTDWRYEGVIQLHDKQQSLLLETDFKRNKNQKKKLKKKNLKKLKF